MMKSIRFISILILISLIGCMSNHKVEHAQSLKDKIHKVVKTKSQLELKSLTSFDWDSVFIFPPYTSFNEINNLIGGDWDGLEQTKIDSDDEFCLLLFINDGELIKYLMQPRSKGDFSRIGKSSIGKESAIFKIIAKEQTNSIWYYLEKADR